MNATGSDLEYSTYFGNHGTECEAIAVDASGNAFVTGYVDGTGFPVTPGAFQTTPGTDFSAFVAKLNTTGSNLLYSTYLSGAGADYTFARAIAVDSSDAAYVTGTTDAVDYPTTANAVQKTKVAKAGLQAAFVTKVNTAGTGLVYSTFLSGSGTSTNGDSGSAIAVDSSGHAYVTGTAYSTDFPTTSGVFEPTVPDPSSQGNNLTFVTEFNLDGSSLLRSTYLGYDIHNGGSGIAVDHEGRPYVAGITTSKAFPTTPDAFQATNTGGHTATLTIFKPDFSDLVYSTYIGGHSSEDTVVVAMDNLENIYLAGETESNDFPLTPGAYHTTFTDFGGFVSQFVFNGATTTSLTSSANPEPLGGKVTFKAHVSPPAGGDTPTGTLAFVLNGTTVAQKEIDGNGVASYSTIKLPVGQSRIVASYLGQADKYASSSGEVTEAITGQVAAPTFSPSAGIHSVSFNLSLATITSGASIYYTLDGSTPTTSSTRFTSDITISSTKTVKAIAAENGDTTSTVSTATYTFATQGIATSTTVASSANPSVVNQPIIFTAKVTAKSGSIPTGSVIFKHGTVQIGTASLSSGVAQLTVSDLPAKQYSITATYLGNSTDAASKSASLLQVVNP